MCCPAIACNVPGYWRGCGNRYTFNTSNRRENIQKLSTCGNAAILPIPPLYDVAAFPSAFRLRYFSCQTPAACLERQRPFGLGYTFFVKPRCPCRSGRGGKNKEIVANIRWTFYNFLCIKCLRWDLPQFSCARLVLWCERSEHDKTNVA